MRIRIDNDNLKEYSDLSITQIKCKENDQVINCLKCLQSDNGFNIFAFNGFELNKNDILYSTILTFATTNGWLDFENYKPHISEIDYSKYTDIDGNSLKKS